MRVIGLALLFLSLAATPRAQAECPPEGLRVWPAPGSVVPPNAVFLLEGRGEAAALVASLDQRHPALIAVREGTLLDVAAREQTLPEWAQSLLQPREKLLPAHEYLLRLHGLGATEPKRFHPTIPTPSGGQRLQWRIGDQPDEQAPRWEAPPRVLSTRREEGGPHTVSVVRVAVTARDEGEHLLYRVRLRERGKGKGWQSWWLAAPEDGVLEVGRGRCGGPVTLSPGHHYELRLSALDGAGNEREAPGPALRLRGPRAR